MRAVIPLVALSACTKPPELEFPEGFEWGTATAGFQVDMGCPTWSDDECLDTASDWYQWVNDPDIIADDDLHTTGEDVRNGPGMWELWEQDAAAMQAEGYQSFRMSFEWSRLFPDGAAEAATTVDELAALANPAAVARYHEMLAALEEAELTPMVTLNHYTLPVWVHDGVACHDDVDCEASGWRNGERIVPLIALYAGFCAREFGGEVDRWGTENEPFANTLAGYVMPNEMRVHPPARSFDGEGAIASIRHQIEAHAAMYDQLHAEDVVDVDGNGAAAEVGIVMNVAAIRPADPERAEDAVGVEHMDYVYHRLFLDGVTSGDWDDDLDGTYDRTRDDLAGRLDWTGVNYYNRVDVGFTGVSLLAEAPVVDFYPTVIEEAYPEGMLDAVALAAEYDLPIHITENGTLFLEDAIPALRGHLTYLHQAIEAGADVRSYHYWSYIDNYEWNHGLDLRFGLFELMPDKTRVRRPAADVYREIVRRNGLDTE
jgi:beta-galactosidase